MNRDTLRLVVTAAFAFCALILYQRWAEFADPERGQRPAGSGPQPQSQALSQDSPANDAELPVVTQQLDTAGDAVPAPEADIPNAADAERSSAAAVRIQNDSLTADFDAGGSLVQIRLLRHSVELDSEPLALLLDDGRRKFVAQTGMLGDGLPNHRDPGWRLQPPSDDAPNRVTAAYESAQLKIERVFELADTGYLANLTYRITNLSSEPLAGHLYFQFLRDGEPPLGYSSLVPSYYGAAIYTERDKYSKYAFDDFEDYPRSSNDGWIGIVQRYFLSAWLDAGGSREYYMRNLNNGDVSVGLIRPLARIDPGATATVEQPLFVGALEQELLGELEPEAGAGLSLAVDYGILTILCAPLFSLLSFIYSLVGNWGVAIMLLTLLLKLLFFPLSAKSYRSMAKMKALAPQIQRIRERTGDDRQAMQQEIMSLYRKQKVNPFGGCLPILVQIPVFIALYWVLLESVELRQAPLGLWIQDLSAPDPFYVLPVVLCLAMFGQFRLNPTPPDPAQAMVMKIMPIGFAVFAVFFPAGLVVYWVVNTLLSIAQQWQITRSIGQATSK